MEFGSGSGSGSGNRSSDEHDHISPNSHRGNNIQKFRHTPQQIQQLELFYKESQIPNAEQRQQLSRDLGLEPNQIKYWFQNKRNQMKALIEREENNTLRRENDRILFENFAMGGVLKNTTCLHFGREMILQQLQLENEKLKKEHTRLSSIVASITGKPVEEIQRAISVGSNSSYSSSSSSSDDDDSTEGFFGQEITTPAVVVHSTNNLQFVMRNSNDKFQMMETAKRAFHELLHLLVVDAPVWIKSPNDENRLIIHRHSYDNLFPDDRRPYQLTASAARFESSKDSIVLKMNASDLVKMILHPIDWADLFPTIVTHAKPLEIINNEHLGGTLVLMYSKLHILSPLVPSREFFFLRYHEQLDANSWMIVNVSYDCFEGRQTTFSTPCWMLPSGCLIQDLHNGRSKVTWVEHIEVDDKTLTHRLFRDVVCRSQAYGAKRWLVTLRRIYERIEYAEGLGPTASNIFEGGRRNIMKLSERMVKLFCAMLSMPEKVDIPNLSDMYNDGVRVSVHKNTSPGQPQGKIVGAAASFWLPITCQTLYNFFQDEENRPQWDVLSTGNTFKRSTNISCGDKARNLVSIIQPRSPHDKRNIVFLQEGCIDPLGALVVYAPLEQKNVEAVTSGDIDTSEIAILPSGITISGDGCRVEETGSSSSSSSSSSSVDHQPAGSLVTVVLHVLSCDSATKEVGLEVVEGVYNVITSTVKKIKAAFDHEDSD